MRRAPQVEFSATIWKISARTSLLTAFRPRVGRALESHFQYSRKPAPCQPTMVRGVTRMRGFFHCAQSLRNPTQNSLCRVVSRRRGCLAWRASSCRRRARFSRIRSSRERNAATTDPRRYRSSRTMGEFYRMTRKRLRRQVVEFVDVQGFDDPQHEMGEEILASCLDQVHLYHR
jgi:hypothetical protein